MSQVQSGNIAATPIGAEYIFRAELTGITPLLMSHPRGMEKEEVTTAPKSRGAKETVSKEDEAAGRLYIDSTGFLYVPTMAVYGAITEAAKLFQDPDYKRRTLAGTISAALFLPDAEDFILTRDGDPISDYEIDTRRAVNRTTRGAILVSRPKIVLPWTLAVEFVVDADLLGPDLLASVLATAGKRVGILSFRPEKRGPFGRFAVSDYGVVKIDG